jgi:hypothetical protein
MFRNVGLRAVDLVNPVGYSYAQVRGLIILSKYYYLLCMRCKPKQCQSEKNIGAQQLNSLN